MADATLEQLGRDPAFLKLVEEMVDRKVEARLAGVEAQFKDLQGQLAAVKKDTLEERATLLVFSGEMDNLMSAFIVATGAAAMGMEVTMYFTFWGLTALRKTTTYAGKSLPEQMIAAMLPGNAATLATSRMNMLGMGPIFFRHVMAQNNVEKLPDLVKLAKELNVRMVACEMSMGVMGITREELQDGLDYGGVATYLEDASKSKITLFI